MQAIILRKNDRYILMRFSPVSKMTLGSTFCANFSIYILKYNNPLTFRCNIINFRVNKKTADLMQQYREVTEVHSAEPITDNLFRYSARLSIIANELSCIRWIAARDMA